MTENQTGGQDSNHSCGSKNPDSDGTDWKGLEYAALREEINTRIGQRHQLLLAVVTASAVLFGLNLSEKWIPATLCLLPPINLFLAAAWLENEMRIRQLGHYIRMTFESRKEDDSGPRFPGWETCLTANEAVTQARGLWMRRQRFELRPPTPTNVGSLHNANSPQPGGQSRNLLRENGRWSDVRRKRIIQTPLIVLAGAGLLVSPQIGALLLAVVFQLGGTLQPAGTSQRISSIVFWVLASIGLVCILLTLWLIWHAIRYGGHSEKDANGNPQQN